MDMDDFKKLIRDVMQPSKLESVSYTFPTDKGMVYVKMPRLFIELGDSFREWFKEEGSAYLNTIHEGFNEVQKVGGNDYADTISLFRALWENADYYKFLIGSWQIQNERYDRILDEASTEEDYGKVSSARYAEVNCLLLKVLENNALIFKAKAALHFIYETQRIVNIYPVRNSVAPMALGTSLKLKERDLELSGRNIKDSTKILYQQIATFYNGRAKAPMRTNAKFDNDAIDITIKHFTEVTGKTYTPKYIQDAVNWYDKNVKVG